MIALDLIEMHEAIVSICHLIDTDWLGPHSAALQQHASDGAASNALLACVFLLAPWYTRSQGFKSQAAFSPVLWAKSKIREAFHWNKSF